METKADCCKYIYKQKCIMILTEKYYEIICVYLYYIYKRKNAWHLIVWYSIKKINIFIGLKTKNAWLLMFHILNLGDLDKSDDNIFVNNLSNRFSQQRIYVSMRRCVH